MRGDLIRRGPGGEHLPPRQRAARPGRIRGDRAAVVRVLGSVAQARQRRRLGRMRRPPPTRRPARSSGHVTFGFPDSASVSWLLAVADMGGRQSLIASCADELAHGREGIVEPVFSNRPFRSKRFSDFPQSQCWCRSRARSSLRNWRPRAVPIWDPKTRWNNLSRGLASDERQARPVHELTSSIVPRGTSLHHSADPNLLLL